MTAPRNGFKGYTYQQYIFTLLLAKMDTQRDIMSIVAEAPATKQFDDLYVEMISGDKYRIQVKNYPDTTLEDIKITGNSLKIKTSYNEFNPQDNNILIVKTTDITTDKLFWDLDSIEKNGITIIPLDENKVKELLDKFYRTEKRKNEIINLAYAITTKAEFEITQNDLPPLVQMPISMEKNTIILREPIDIIPKGILCIVGKPGVGKSHYVDELLNRHTSAVVYRFWVGSQDENLHIRLAFDKFLDELAMAYFKSPRNFTVDELIDEINKGEKPLVVDGLDHVENYQPLELEKYFEFINRITNGRVIVLTRPIKRNISWNTTELTNWSFEETGKYLEEAFDISDYNLKNKIYDIADGYPIITFYIAEHYKMNGEICAAHKIPDLNKYYDLLLNDANTNSLMTLFATSNSFFTKGEVEILLGNGELADAVHEFIKSHPYLFRIIENRISLLHDSLNTYLRNILPRYPERLKTVNSIVQKSLMDGNVEYMARMNSFSFDNDFYDQLLVKYSNMEDFENLLQSTIDINSITSFYCQLQQVLERRETVLSVYQYYSFSLLYQMLERNDTTEYESIIYQVLRYINNDQSIPDSIYSSGAIWNLYILLLGKKNDYKNYLEKRKYAEYHLGTVTEKLNAEYTFFDKLKEPVNNDNFEKKMMDEKSDIQKVDLLVDYLIGIWIHQEKSNPYFQIIEKFVLGDEEEAKSSFEKSILKYNMEKMWRDTVLLRVRFQLHELGFFGDKNWFRNTTLKEQIVNHAPDGSFSICDFILATIRLANYEKRKLDIYSINSYWIMYQMRKDYTVYNIDVALIVFEQHGLIEEMHSLDIIERLMKQSEKGIRHLMASYIDSKPVEFTKKLANNDYFLSEDCPIDVFALDSAHIDYCSKTQFIKAMHNRLKFSSYNRILEYNDISDAIHSKYQGILLDAMDYYDYSVFCNDEGIDAEIQNVLVERGIKYISRPVEREENPYIPFEYGYIHEEDSSVIFEQKLSYFDIARYTDGWDSCFPYIDLFLKYNIDDIRRDYLTIIHRAMFARTISLQRIGLWVLLLGNIPKFIDAINIEVDWNELYRIFLRYLQLSLIWF